MALFPKFNQPTTDQMESRTEYVQVENEMLSKEGEVAEKKAVIAQLKKKYGSDWRKIIGIQYLPSLSDLRAFLTSARSGLKGASGGVSNPNISPLPPSNLRTAGKGDGSSLSVLPNKKLRRL